ncbi:MAG: SHOCT domain-containing protein [Sphingobacteriales bacterium]|nr:MAG: SHOCT domain-containing protein [Sphingobacteriales bacterium]
MSISFLHRQRIYTLIAGCIGIFSLFMPWFTVSASAFGYNQSKSTNGFEDNGSVVFLAFMASIVACFIGDKTKQFMHTSWWIAISSGGVAILTIITISAKASNRTANFGFVRAELGLGYILAMMAAIAIIGLAWFYKKPAAFQNMVSAAQATVEKLKSQELKQYIDRDVNSSSVPAAGQRGVSLNPGSDRESLTDLPRTYGAVITQRTEMPAKSELNKIAEIEKLISLKDKGYLTNEEFELLKKDVLF